MGALFKTLHKAPGVSGIHFATVFALWALVELTVAKGCQWHKLVHPQDTFSQATLFIVSNQQVILDLAPASSFSVVSFKPRRIQGPKGPTGGAGTRWTS